MRVWPLLFAILILTSCERVLLPPSAPAENSVSFKELWTAIDRGYAHFEGHAVIWDSVYSKLSPSVSDDMTREAFFQLCRRLIDTLEDPEIILETGFSEYHYSPPGVAPLNFDKYLLETRYWKNLRKTGPLFHMVMDSIGYIYCPDFSSPPSAAELDEMIHYFETEGAYRGTILDLRSNEEGLAESIFPLIRRVKVSDSIMDKSSYLFSTAYKNGPKHDDFTPYKDSWVEMNKTHFLGRFLILTNRGTRGAAHLFAGAAQSIANVTLLGDTTGGGGSFLGTQELSNGWKVHFPASKTRMSNGNPSNKGVVPHIRVDMKESDRQAGIDSILEAALQLLRQ